jgi:hypothetical protein
LTLANLEPEYNRLEKLMLEEFYQHLNQHKDAWWVHWNMRDINYGFQALAHRYRVLGGQPVEINDSKLRDLARIMVALFGVKYAGHPRLTSLMKKNHMEYKDFLNGQQEAEAFEKRDYVKLHQSTLRKVDVLANLLERLGAGTLKIDATLTDKYGGILVGIGKIVKDQWIFILLGLIATIVGIIGFVQTFFH